MEAALARRQQRRLGPDQGPQVIAPPPIATRRDFFVYTVFFDNLAPAAASSKAIQIQSDSDFELQKLTMFADIANASQTASTRVLPLATVQITDTGTGRQLFNSPVAIPAIFGDGQIPFILPTTKLFSKNASVSIDVSNFDAASTYDIRLFLIGSKIFTY